MLLADDCFILLSGKLQNGRKIHPENQIMMVGFAARGQNKKRMGLPKARSSKEGEYPFFVEEKQAFAPPTFRTNPKVQVVVQMSPDWEGQRLWGLFR